VGDIPQGLDVFSRPRLMQLLRDALAIFAGSKNWGLKGARNYLSTTVAPQDRVISLGIADLIVSHRNVFAELNYPHNRPSRSVTGLVFRRSPRASDTFWFLIFAILRGFPKLPATQTSYNDL
jgi:hypothetical protein